MLPPLSRQSSFNSTTSAATTLSASPTQSSQALPPQAPPCLVGARVVLLGSNAQSNALAAALHRRGVRVTVLHAEPRDVKAPYAVPLTATIQKRALPALRALPDLLPQLAARAVPQTPTIHVSARDPFDACDQRVFVSPRLCRGLCLPYTDADAVAAACAAACSRVVHMRAAVTDVVYQPDGSIRLAIDTPGGRSAIRTRFLLACDGALSKVLPAVLQRTPHVYPVQAGPVAPDEHRDDDVDADADKLQRDNQQKDGDTDVVLRKHLTVAPAALPDILAASPRSTSTSTFTLPPSPTARIVLHGVAPTAHDRVKLVITPASRYATPHQERTAFITAPATAAIWRAPTSTAAYEALRSNFATLPLQALVPPAAMHAFVTARAQREMPCMRRAPPLAALVGDARDAAVVLLGRAAHPLPPDHPQGFSADLQDVSELTAVLDAAPTDASLRSLATAYAQRRSADTSALLLLVQRDADPDAVLPAVLRPVARAAASVLPHLFETDVRALLHRDEPYVHVLCRRDSARRRLCGLFVALPLAAAAITVTVVKAVVSRGRGDREHNE